VQLVFLPKYSPDLNPIEQFFAKPKHWLRKAARRTTDAVCSTINPILNTVSALERANYFANAGYEQT
jgi:putative transposase